MIRKWIASLLSGAALIGFSLSSVLPASAEQAPDKNGPGVTRVSIVQGSVVVQRGDSNKQVAAVVNAPLLPGDYISTGGTSRGELQFDGSSAIRLGGNVQARITNDDPHSRQLQLADGTIELGLVRSNHGVLAVDTPSVTVRTEKAGDYRISIGHDGSSWVTARRGTAEIVTPQRTYTLQTGKTLVARGSASNPSVTYTQEVGYDSFDDFNAKRDQTMVAALDASPNLNPDIAGYDNLGAYGQWQDVAGYGQAWVPQQSSDWSPYSDGNWTWEDGYGWTWVANEPWGWVPYHYGNWFYADGYGWAWYPPAYSAYPAWSPALVGFFGFGAGGPGWDLSIGFGYPYIGWYPIAPDTPFYPWWPGWAWTGVGWGWGGWGCCGWGWGGNVYNVTYIRNVYRYFPHGGVHGVAVAHLQHGTVNGHTFTVNHGNISNHVGMIHGAVPISPTRDSLGFGGRQISGNPRLSHAFESPRFASADRMLAARGSFDEQQRAISHQIQAHANASRENAVNRENAANRENAVNRENRGTSGSWQRFNETRANQTRGGEVRGEESRQNDLHSSEVRSNDVRSNDARELRSAPQSTRQDRAPSSSWGRFSEERGSVSSSSLRDSYDRSSESRGASSYSRSEPSYSRGESGYGRDSYGGASYGRNPYESYSRNNYPSYSHSAYPSYSRGSYPSYSRGSYGSSPGYSRGYGGYSSPRSYGQYSAPRSPGGYSAPRSSGGYSAPHPSGGGGAQRSGGGDSHGRPPK
jgi:hypothetical protein